MIVNKFAISDHTALKLDVQALRSYLSVICEYEHYILPNIKRGGLTFLVFTMSLCALELKRLLISLLFQIIQL